MSITSPTLTASATLAALADFSCITESLQLVESITRDWLKTESQKPTPPTPPDLQPAVHTLWRCSTIRKNLLGVAKSPTPSSDPTAPGRPQSKPEDSEAAILRSLNSVPASKLIELASRKVLQESSAQVKAVQSHRESTAPAPSTPSIPSTPSTQSTPPVASHTHPISVPPAAAHPAQPIATPPSTQHPTPPVPTPMVPSIRNSPFAIRNSPSASIPANSSLPPKFRYPPPKRVTV